MYGITETTVHVSYVELDADLVARRDGSVGIAWTARAAWRTKAGSRPTRSGVSPADR